LFWGSYEIKEIDEVTSAVVLVNTDLDREKTVLENIKKLEGVEEAHALWGVYDLLVKVKTHSVDKLKELTQMQLKRLVGVSTTLTLMIVENEVGVH